MSILKELIEICGALEVFENRNEDEGYYEVVFHNKDIAVWEKCLSDVLGPAVKPTDTKPSKEDLSVTKEYGGIAKNQTLFKKECDGTIIIAMLWPWGNRIHTTLKAVVILKK